MRWKDRRGRRRGNGSTKREGKVLQFYDKRAFSDRAMNGLMNVFYFLGSGGFFPLILFLRLSDEPFYLFFSCLSYLSSAYHSNVPCGFLFLFGDEMM